MFCPDLQTLLKPIVELTRKDRPFIWGEAQKKAFREVKLRLTNPPVLHLPKAEGRFILYSDTSIEGTGSSLWQIQEGKPRLIGYASKTLPEPCSRYSVTELEMTGLLVNMNIWKNLLKHREFNAAVDHVAVAQILKAKTEPATTRIMRLLDRLSAYSFNLIDVGVTEGLETLDPEIRIPTEEDFVLPPPLESLLDKAKTAYKFLPKQGDIDRLIAKINKKVLRDTNSCVDLRDLKVAYLTSSHFRDIYLYLLQNRVPLGKGEAKQLDQNARNYIILDGLLF